LSKQKLSRFHAICFSPGEEEESSHDSSPPFQERVKVLGLVANGRFLAWWPMEGSWLGGQWKVLGLVANGRFFAWWPMEDSWLGGQWKIPLLGGQWKEKENVPLHLLPLPPKQTYLNPHFYPLTQRFYLTTVLGHSLPIPFLSLRINYEHMT